MSKDDCKWYIEHDKIETMKSLLLLDGFENFDGTRQEYEGLLNIKEDK